MKPLSFNGCQNDLLAVTWFNISVEMPNNQRAEMQKPKADRLTLPRRVVSTIAKEYHDIYANMENLLGTNCEM